MRAIYAHPGYREYLSAYYRHRKETDRAFTYRSFSEAAGLRSPNYLKLVIDGTRDLTVANIHQFARALRLSGDERQYFETLVLRDQSDGDARGYYDRRLADLRAGKPKATLKVPKGDRVFSHWYYPVALLCLNGREARVEHASLAKALGIDVETLRGIADALVNEKTLLIEQGRYRLGAANLVGRDPMSSSVVQRRFLQEQLERSQRAFKRRYASGAKFRSHTFMIPPGTEARYVEAIDRFLEQVSLMSDSMPGDHPMQLNLQLFAALG